MPGESSPPSAYLDGLRLLARRELSVAGLRARLADRDHSPAAIDEAVARLLRDTRAATIARVARAYARTASGVKGRGRLRVARELQAMGIAREVAAEALGEVFGDLDERALIARAIQKKLRGRTRIADRAEQVRLFQYLMRQGFSPAAAALALRNLGRQTNSIE